MKEIIDVVKEGKVGINLDNPVGPRKNDSDDIDHRNSPGKKRPVLHPGNDIVESPRNIQPDGGDREVPTIFGLVKEYKGTMSHGKN